MKSKIKFRFFKEGNKDSIDKVQNAQDFDLKKYLSSPDFRKEVQKAVKKETRKIERKIPIERK